LELSKCHATKVYRAVFVYARFVKTFSDFCSETFKLNKVRPQKKCYIHFILIEIRVPKPDHTLKFC